MDITLGSPNTAGGISVYAVNNIQAEETEIMPPQVTESQFTKTNPYYSTMRDQLPSAIKAKKVNKMKKH